MTHAGASGGPPHTRRCRRAARLATFLTMLTTCAVLFGGWVALGIWMGQRHRDRACAADGLGGRATHRAGPGNGAGGRVTNTVGMELVLVPAGEFMMGNSLVVAEEIAEFKRYGADVDAKCFKFEYPRHRVRISRPFYMGARHVTRGQFRRFVEDTGYKTEAEKGDRPGANGVDPQSRTFFGFRANRTWRNVAFPQTDDHPVVCVSWNDAVAFCMWLSRREAGTYRLPTEAEWEYACRAGTTTRYWCGNDPEKLAEVANTGAAEVKARFGGDAPTTRAGDGYLFTSPVGSFLANPFGLYDMHGNAWQWCADWMDGRYYEESPFGDPTGPGTGSCRVLRGGAWNFGALDCRSASRLWYSPGSRNDYSGFRVVREKESAQAVGAKWSEKASGKTGKQ